MTMPEPWTIWSHAGPLIRTTESRAALAARAAIPRGGWGTGSAGSGGSPEKTSGNPMRSSTSPSWFARTGGAGKAASTARTTADRWSERATVGNGPEARLSPRNQIARISAPAASADPPTESAVFSRVARVRRRSRIPNTDPTASPIAPISSTVPSAAAAFAGSDSNRPATCGASHAPITKPITRPPSPATCRTAPRR